MQADLGKPRLTDAERRVKGLPEVWNGLVLNRATRRAIAFGHDKVNGVNRPRQH